MIALALIVSPVFTVGFVAGRTPGRAVKEPVALRGGAATPLGERSVTRTGLSPGSLTVGRAVKEPGSEAGAIALRREPKGTIPTNAPGSLTATSHGLYRHHSAAYWAWIVRQRGRKIRSLKAELHRRWRPTVDYALHLASAVYGVPYGDLRSVAWCESKFDPFARNGRYLGLFQMHWSPFGFSPFDPVASALSAAATVGHDGSWRQWECKP